MSTDFVVDAQTRKVQGSGASRRLRREGKVPAILYGGDAAPVMLEVDHNEMFKHLRNEAFFSHVLTINVDGKAQKAVLRDLQRHPVKPLITHLDFFRVSANEAIRVSVPVHLVNEETCKGVKTGGGIINRQIIEVEVECLPADLPEYLEADLQDVGVGESLHLSSLQLPKGVSIVAFLHGDIHDHDQPVASVVKPRGEKVDDMVEGDAADAADGDSSDESDD